MINNQFSIIINNRQIKENDYLEIDHLLIIEH